MKPLQPKFVRLLEYYVREKLDCSAQAISRNNALLLNLKRVALRKLTNGSMSNAEYARVPQNYIKLTGPQGRKRHHIGKSGYVYRRLGKEPSMDFQADKIVYTPVTKITADYPDPKLAGKKFHYAVSPRNSNLPGWPTSPPTM